MPDSLSDLEAGRWRILRQFSTLGDFCALGRSARWSGAAGRRVAIAKPAGWGTRSTGAADAKSERENGCRVLPDTGGLAQGASRDRRVHRFAELNAELIEVKRRYPNCVRWMRMIRMDSTGKKTAVRSMRRSAAR